MAEKTTRAPKRNLVSFTKPENFEYVSEFVKILLAVVSKKRCKFSSLSLPIRIISRFYLVEGNLTLV